MSDDTTPERHLEVETKLDAGAEFRLPALADLPRLRDLGMAAATTPATRQLDAVYFDTDRLDLLRARLTLRRRTGGDDAGWHLKLPAGPAARTEVRLPLSGNGSGGDEIPGGLQALVRGIARGRPLMPVARVRTRRTAHHLMDSAGIALVEVADDEVIGVGLLPAGPAERRWRELEVELEAGTAEQLAAAVDALRQAGARPAGAASKVGRLLAGTGDTPPGEIPPGPSAGDALRSYLSRQRDLLEDADIRLRAPDPDADAAHDARAAARRIRSALRVYRPLLAGGVADQPVNALRDLGRALSGMRDLDVARLRLDESFPEGPAVTGLRRRLADRRERQAAAVHAVVDSSDYLDLLAAIDDLVDAPAMTAAAGTPARDTVPPLLIAAWLHLRAGAETVLARLSQHDSAGYGPGGEGPSDATSIHQIRKQAKTVRYAADLAAAADLADAVPTSFLALLEGLQDVLGAYQDCVTTASLVATLASDTDLTDSERALLDRWAAVEQRRGMDAASGLAAAWSSLPVLPAAITGSSAT